MKTNNFAARSTSFSLSITWIIDTNDTINRRYDNRRKRKDAINCKEFFEFLEKISQRNPVIIKNAHRPARNFSF